MSGNSGSLSDEPDPHTAVRDVSSILCDGLVKLLSLLGNGVRLVVGRPGGARLFCEDNCGFIFSASVLACGRSRAALQD